MAVLPVLASAAVTLCGLYCLRLSQGASGARGRWLAATFVGAGLTAGLAAALADLGADLGVTLWLGFGMAAGFLITLAAALSRRRRMAAARPPRATRTQAERGQPRPLRTLPVLLAAGPGILASLVLMLALSLFLPGGPAERALAGLLLWPLLAAGITLYLFLAEAPLRAHARIGGIALLAGLAAAFDFLA